MKVDIRSFVEVVSIGINHYILLRHRLRNRPVYVHQNNNKKVWEFTKAFILNQWSKLNKNVNNFKLSKPLFSQGRICGGKIFSTLIVKWSGCQYIKVGWVAIIISWLPCLLYKVGVYVLNLDITSIWFRYLWLDVEMTTKNICG